MDEVFDSVVRVVWDPDGSQIILVEFGEPMWGEVALDGGQAVDVAGAIRSAGKTAWPRGNEEHALTFDVCGETTGIAAAFERRLTRAIAAPRDQADVLLQFESGSQFRLKRAAVERWPNGQVGRLTRESLVIRGGELLADVGTYDPLIGWGDRWFETEEGEIVVSEENELFTWI